MGISAPKRDIKRSRFATSALFLANGAIFSNLLPRYPEVKAALQTSNTTFGLCIAAMPVGAMVSGLATAALIRRFGSARVAVYSSVLVAIFTLAAGSAPFTWMFGVAMFATGAADSLTDVAQNAYALRLQRRYGRSIINSMHAVWSVGAILGGAMGASAVALRISIAAQLSISAVTFGAICLFADRCLLPERDHDVSMSGGAVGPRRHDRIRRVPVFVVLAVLAILGISGAFVEDAGQSWAALYLRDVTSTPEAFAGAGFIAFAAFQFIGRVAGDQLVDRFGERSVTRAGGMTVVVGIGLALAQPSAGAAVAGFAAAGCGSATVIPAALHGADSVQGLRPAIGLAVVTWFMRVGFAVSPLVVGAIADASDLRIALAFAVPIAGLAIALVASVLPDATSNVEHPTPEGP